MGIDSQVVLDAAELDPHAPEALHRLQTAAQLYHGVYLPDDLYEDWVQVERQRLALAYETVQLKLAQAYAHRRQYAEAIQVCRQGLVAHPTHEGFVEHLVHYTSATGQPAIALATYERLSEALAADLATCPSPHLTHLIQQVRAGTLTPSTQETVKPPLQPSQDHQPAGGARTEEGLLLRSNLNRSGQLLDDLSMALAEMRLKRLRLQTQALQAQTIRSRLTSL